MFDSVGRRLALLNALSVLFVIALVGATTYALLRASLAREADRALSERAQAARLTWEPLFTPGGDRRALTPETEGARQEEDAQDDDEGEDEGHELVESGDTLVYAFDADGALIGDARGVAIDGLPSIESARAALEGDEDRRTIRIDEETVRIYSEPVVIEGVVAGAIQTARGQSEHESELRLVLFASIAGIGFGALIAIPSGMFLARRAMRPISAAFDRQRAFVADASHELRTPLAVIRANTELVQRLPGAASDVRAELGLVLDEVDGMSRMVDDLLLLARLDDSSLLLERETQALAPIVRSALQAMDALAEAKGVGPIRVHADDMTTACLDAGRMRQVVRILVDNAIKYTPAGGEIDVTIGRQGDRALLSVRDTGIGIAAEDREQVFRRFYRADPARARHTGGAGLGLTIARALIDAHGGSITIESVEGRGATVTCFLPATC